MKKILKAWVLFLSLFGMLAFAHGANVATFDIKVNPSKVKVGESIDVSISTLDSNGNIVKNYNGEIYVYIQQRPDDENLQFYHVFSAVDQWIYKIENGMKFPAPGTYTVIVIDSLDGDISAETNIEVTGETKLSTGDISITSPQSGTTIPSTQVSVSGSTLPNHSVLLTVNEDSIPTSSNTSGIFEVKVTGLKNGENFLVAEVLDADDNVIGSSQQVFFEVAALAPQFQYILLDPEQDEYEPHTTLAVTVSATPNVTTEITLDNQTILLTETTSGMYTWEIVTPENADIYPIDVKLTGELGAITEEKWATSLSVFIPEPEVEEVEEEVPMLAAVDEEPLAVTELDCAVFQKELDVSIRSKKSGDQSIIYWEKSSKASSYNVYKKNGNDLQLIANVVDPEYVIDITGDVVKTEDFVVKAHFKDDVCDVEGDESNMTRVQTGTKAALLLLVALLWAGWAVYAINRRKQA